MNSEEQLREENIEKLRNQSTYLFKRGIIGFEKAKYKALDFLPIYEIIGKEDEKDEYLEIRKQHIKDLQADVDSFYLTHQDEIGLPEEIIGGVIEGITDVSNLAVNVGVAIATGGTSIPAQFATGLGADFATLYYDTNEFEDRNPTALELGLTAGMSIVGTGINYGATKWNASKQSIKDYGVKSTSTSNPTFEKINPSKIMEEQGDTLAFNGATKQAYYSQYKNTDVDPYLNIKLSTDEIKQNPTMLGRMYEEYKFNNPSEASPYYFKRYTANNNTTYDNMLNNLESTMDNWVENTYYKAAKKETTPTTNGIDIDIERQVLFIDNELSVNKLKSLNEYNNLMGSKSIDVLNYFNGRENKTDLVEAYIKSDYTNMDIPEAYKKGIGAMSDDEWLLTSMRNDFDIYNANNETMYRITNEYKNLLDFETGHSKLSLEFFDEVILSGKAKGNDGEVLIKLLPEEDYVKMSKAYNQYIEDVGRAIDEDEAYEAAIKFVRSIDPEKDLEKYGTYFDDVIEKINNIITKESSNLDEIYDISSFEKSFNKTDLTKKHRIASRHIPGDEATVRKNIRIQRAINKQKIMMDYYDYYKVNFDKQVAQDVKIEALVADGKLEELANKVKPIIEKYFSIPDDITLSNEQTARIWHEFLTNLNMTKNSWKYTDKSMSLSDLSYMFKSQDSFYDFFINEMSKQDYLKHNTELLQSFYSRQIDDISRLMTFGTTSPYKILNEVDFKSQSILSKQLDKGLNDGEKAFISNVKTKMNNYITNTMMPWNKGNVSGAIKISRAVRKAVTSSTLGLTGTTELFAPNWVLSFYKASKYDNSLWKQDLISLAKAMKAMGADATVAKYRMSELGIELGKLAKFDNDWTDKAVDIALILQQASDNQFKKFAHIRTATILDNMSDDITKLQPELLSVLKKYGINENNYLDFRNYVKKHISANNDTINFDTLLNSSLKEDERFLLVANELIEDIGSHTRNMKVSDASYKSDEIINWLYSYRTFKRFLNKDLLRRVSYYQDVNGVSKARFTSEGVKHTLKELPLANLTYFALPLAAVSGAWQSILKEQQKSLGDGALMYANFKNSVDENIQQYSMEGNVDEDETAVGYLFKLGKHVGKMSALNLGKTFGYDFSDGFLKGIKSEFETSAPIYKPIKLAIESYTTFTDPEKQLYGTNVEEAGVKLVEFSSSFIPAGRLSYTWINNYLSTAEEIASNVKGSNEKKTNLRLYMKEYYDITDDEYDKLESASIKINNNKLNTLSNEEKKIVDKTLNKELLNTMQEQADNMQVVADYIGDKSASFEKLNMGQKNIYNKIAKIKGWSETEKESHKAEFAMYALGNRESIWYAIQEHYGITKEELGY